MDSTTLRSILNKTDGSQQGIHQAAGGMMRFYDKGSDVAVAEWRNALLQARPDQTLPLLYVANEVLQNSKRNRGSKFLVAFAPVLGPALKTMVQRNPQDLDRIRRTTKIWGDRRVFSIRFVNDLLQGLEPFREEQKKNASTFSPQANNEEDEEAPQPVSTEKESPSLATDDDDVQEEDDVVKQLTAQDDSSDEDEDGFGDSSMGHLDVALDFQSSAFLNAGPATKKRRRNSSMGSMSTKRRKSILSTSSLMELWNQVASLQEGLETSQALLKQVAAPPSVEDDQLVGDELLDEYRNVCKAQEIVQQQKHALHKIARDRKVLEGQAVRYIPWLQASLKNDDDDIQFCHELENKIKLIQNVHGMAHQAREEQREKEAQERQQQEEKRRKQQEEEERRKFMESAMKKESEAKPGMVWSRERQEYVYLNTDESWRD